MLATLFLIFQRLDRNRLNWKKLELASIIVQGGQYLGEIFGRPIIMLISVPGNTRNNMDWCLHFLAALGIFAGPQNMTDITLRWRRLMEKKRVRKVSTYLGKLQNQDPPSEDGSWLELASWRVAKWTPHVCKLIAKLSLQLPLAE